MHAMSASLKGLPKGLWSFRTYPGWLLTAQSSTISCKWVQLPPCHQKICGTQSELNGPFNLSRLNDS
jgi:hypothetical protein